MCTRARTVGLLCSRTGSYLHPQSGPSHRSAYSTIKLSTEDCLKASSFLADALLDPETSHSSKSKDAPITRAFKIDGTVFDYWAQPENKQYLTRFSHAMYAINQFMRGDESLTTGG